MNGSSPPSLANLPLRSTNPAGPVVLIATPAYGGVQPLAVNSLINAMRALGSHGYRTQPYWSANCSLVPNAREELLGVFLRSHAAWLAMIDNDIGYPPDLLGRMIAFGAPMMAAAVPYRTIDVAEIEASGRYLDGIQFNLTPLDRSELGTRPQKDGFLRLQGADGVGGAFLVMRRDTVERMVDAYPELGVDTGPEIATAALFAQFVDRRRHWGEDTSFMRRWHALPGAETWVCMDADVTHTGPMTIGGNLAKALGGDDDPVGKRCLKGASGHILRDLRARVDELRATPAAEPTPATPEVPGPAQSTVTVGGPPVAGPPAPFVGWGGGGGDSVRKIPTEPTPAETTPTELPPLAGPAPAPPPLPET